MPSHCDAPQWWEAPVIVGGSGGSGTRGVVMLLESLGVRMACINSTLLSLTEPRLCMLPCNPASDCALINSFRGPGTSWMRDNFSHAAACHVDPTDVEASSNASNSEMCGGSKSAALRRLREAVRPEYRHPLRWGLKNPHSTYYVNVLRIFFPCLVYVNTVSAKLCPCPHASLHVLVTSSYPCCAGAGPARDGAHRQTLFKSRAGSDALWHAVGGRWRSSRSGGCNPT